MRTVSAQCSNALPLGRLGENDYTVINFDVTLWLAEYPNGVIGLYNQIPGASAAYPIANLQIVGNVAKWTITSTELTQTGKGRCELVLLDGGTVAKSAIYETQVFDALDGSGEAPEPWDDWREVFVQLKAEAEQAAQTATDAAQTAESASEAIQNLSVSSTTLTPGSAATVEKTVDPETGAVSLAFGIPEGQQGETGPIGATPDISIGTVTTGAAGSSASANITGTPENPVLNLTIPRGDKGETGETGEKGDTGATPDISVGTVSTLPLGSDATAFMTGTPENPVLNIGIPVGLDDVATEATLAEIDAESKTITGLLRQIVEDGGSSKDLNGYSLAPGAAGEVVLTYTDPDTQEAASVAMTTDTTGKAIADTLAEMANNWKGAVVNA
jgi:hypothetical protein